MHKIDCDTDCTFKVPNDLMQNFVSESEKIPNAQNDIHVTTEVFNKPLELKFDSGAICNVISLQSLKALKIPFEIDRSRKANRVYFQTI